MKTRAAIVTAPEQPVIIDELGVPDPKPHQVIVKLFSTGVCRSNVRDATGANPVPYPALLGHEGVGVTYRGQIVSSPWYTWAEDALAPGEIVIPIPKEDASLESCIVGCAVLTGGGADFVFEAIGKRVTQEQILPATRSGGTGANNVGGTAVLIGAPAPDITLDPSHFVVHQRQYRGSQGASVPEKDFPMYLRWNREGKWPLDKQVTRQYKLDDANQAVEDLAAGRIAGRAIIVL